MAYTSTHVMRLSDGKSLAARIKDKIFLITHHDAGTHNAHYYPANLGSALTAAQSSAIRNGTFAGMYPGGNWTIAVRRIHGLTAAAQLIQKPPRLRLSRLQAVIQGGISVILATNFGHITSKLYRARFFSTHL